MAVLFLLQAIVLSAPIAPAPSAGPPRVLVLAPETRSLDAATVASLTGVITTGLASDERLVVVGGGDIADLATLEVQKQVTGCDSNGCFAEIADALGARYVVFSDVNMLGDAFVLNVRVIDTTTSSAAWRLSLQEASLATIAARVLQELHGVGDALVVGSVAPPLPSSQFFNTGIALVAGGTLVASKTSSWVRVRDPQKHRCWVVLVDGSQDQLDSVERCAKITDVGVTIVLDVIHVLEYSRVAASFAIGWRSRARTEA